jgi:hypothetical protein
MKSVFAGYTLKMGAVRPKMTKTWCSDFKESMSLGKRREITECGDPISC